MTLQTNDELLELEHMIQYLDQLFKMLIQSDNVKVTFRNDNTVVTIPLKMLDSKIINEMRDNVYEVKCTLRHAQTYGDMLSNVYDENDTSMEVSDVGDDKNM